MPFFQLHDIHEVELFNGIKIRAVYGERLSVSVLEFPPFSQIPPHRHPNEQIGIVEEGEMEYTIGDHTMLCRKGTAFVIPPNMTHSHGSSPTHPPASWTCSRPHAGCRNKKSSGRPNGRR